MITQGMRAFHGRRVLLLQGPIGPFFRRLATDLTRSGAQVFKVNFNGGDWLFGPSDSFNFRGSIDEWPAYFEFLLDRLNIDLVMLFGDCRPIHRTALEIARMRSLEIGVFEEGYLRPDYVTLERCGVNGHSRIPRTPLFYVNESSTPPLEESVPVGNTFWFSVLWAVLYYLAAAVLKPWFRHYRHHRPLTLLEALPWCRSVWRKWYYSLKERGMIELLTGRFSKRFFLVPLQVHNDAQVHVHSRFDSVAHFLAEVIDSFAKYAPSRTVLVIKHHPADRGYFDYAKLIRELSAKHAVHGRCFYIHDQHLPSLLKHARGVVVINSTVGLSALNRGTPVKVCGNAIYDIEGITFRGPLMNFWRDGHESPPNPALFLRFRRYLIRFTQLNGSFYKRLPVPAMATGMIWTEQKGDQAVHAVRSRSPISQERAEKSPSAADQTINAQ